MVLYCLILRAINFEGLQFIYYLVCVEQMRRSFNRKANGSITELITYTSAVTFLCKLLYCITFSLFRQHYLLDCIADNYAESTTNLSSIITCQCNLLSKSIIMTGTIQARSYSGVQGVSHPQANVLSTNHQICHFCQ